MLRLVFSRAGLAMGAAAAAAAIVIACGSVDEGAFANGGDSGGPPLDAGGDGGFPPFDGSAVDAGGAPTPTSLLVVHASPDLEDLRFCFSPGENSMSFGAAKPLPSDTPMPESNYPGVPVGGGAVLPMLDMFLRNGFVSIYAIRAKLIASADKQLLPCAQLICNGGNGPDCLTKNLDYFPLQAMLPTTGWGGASTAFLDIRGCLPNTNAPPNVCGADYQASTGNLAARVTPLRILPLSEPGVMVVAFVQLSSGVDEQWLAPGADASSFGLGYGPIGTEAGAPLVAAKLKYGDFVDPQPLALPDAQADYTGIGFTLEVNAPDAALSPRMDISLATLAKISDPRLLPMSYLHERGAYLIAIVGDPSDPDPLLLPDGGANPNYHGRALHALALPAATDAGSL